MKFRNISPLGDLWVRDLDVVVEANHEVEVTGETAESFLKQPDNWRRVDKPVSRESKDDESDNEEE
jgi:hypothetical protein